MKIGHLSDVDTLRHQRGQHVIAGIEAGGLDLDTFCKPGGQGHRQTVRAFREAKLDFRCFRRSKGHCSQRHCNQNKGPVETFRHHYTPLSAPATPLVSIILPCAGRRNSVSARCIQFVLCAIVFIEIRRSFRHEPHTGMIRLQFSEAHGCRKNRTSVMVERRSSSSGQACMSALRRGCAR